MEMLGKMQQHKDVSQISPKLVGLTSLCLILLDVFQSSDSHPYSDHLDRTRYTKAGDIILGGLFQIFVYNITEQSCGKPNSIGDLKRAEAMVYAIDKVNNDEYLLPNISIGFDIRDTCTNVAVTLGESLNFVSCSSRGHSCCAADSCDANKTLIAGVVGPYRSSSSEQAAILFGLHHMAQISYISTSDELSDNKSYPYFLRTVGADTFQVKAMIDIILQYKWNYISFLNSEGSYGTRAQRRFIQLAPENKICIGITRTIALSSDAKAYDEVIEELLELQNDTHATVVIVFGQLETVQGILSAATRKEVKRRFIWIGSDSWAAHGVDAIKGNEEAALGAFTVDPLSNTLDDFNEYFRSLGPLTSDNPWLPSYIEHHGDCELPNACNTSNLRELDSDETSHGTLVMDAVFAFAHALDKMCRQDPSTCSDADSFDRDELLKHLLNTSFDSLANERVSFLPNGDSAGRYLIRYLQETNGDYQYVSVGSWPAEENGTEVISEKVPWYLEIDNKTGVPISVCSLPCAPGEKQLINPDNLCCWSCIKCQPFEIVMDKITECVSCSDKHKYRIPNKNFTACVDIEVLKNAWTPAIFTLSASGLMFAIVVTSLYIYHRENPLIKASSRELSYVMFVGIFLAYITSLLFGVVNLTNGVCVMHRLGPPIATSLIYVSLAVKTIRLYRIFRASVKSARKPRFIRPRSQVCLTLAITTIPTIWVIIWMIFDTHPSVEKELRQTSAYYLQTACILSTGETIGVMVWNVVVVLICCIFAFLTRKLPENYNETKFTMFCSFCSLIILLAFSSTYFTVDDAYDRSGCMALGLIVNATVTLLCLYAIKIYAIYYVKKEDINVRMSFKSHQGSASLVENPGNVQRTGSVEEQNGNHTNSKGSAPATSGIQPEQSSGFESQSFTNHAIDEEEKVANFQEVSDTGLNPEVNHGTKLDKGQSNRVCVPSDNTDIDAEF